MRSTSMLSPSSSSSPSSPCVRIKRGMEMFVLVVFIGAIQGIFGHMVNNEFHDGLQMHVEQNIAVPTATAPSDEEGLSLELHRSLAFYPSSIDFGAWSVGTTRSHIVTLVNKNLNRSVYLSSISGKTPAFYSSFFEDKVVPPQGNTTFNVVFLPRSYGQVETNLMIHTSFGQAKLPVKGEGKECPYRLRPLVGIKAPYNATINPEIHMYNPHTKPIQILEIYSTGGQFQLELPSGGQEGPQALWEIPPHTTKPIIRIKFHGAQPGNHTAYIRIKISGGNQKKDDNVLVIPVEFEILGNYGIYSPQPIIDFGRLTTADGIKMIKVNLTNSGKEKMEILECRLNNVKNLIDFKRSNFTLILHAKDLKENVTIINGELLIKTQTKQNPKQKMQHSITIRGEIYKGSLRFQANTTIFITKAKNYTKGEREFYIKNSFAIPISVSNVSVENNDTSIFKLINFKPIIINSGQKIVLFKIGVLNETANFISPLKIITNLTTYEFPIVVCKGLLKRFTSIDSANLSKQHDEGTLDYGIVQIGEQSFPGLILMKNPNPIPIQLLRWNFTNPREVYYQSMFLGCLKPSYRTNTTAAEKFDFCLNLPPGEVAAFQLIVESYTINTFTGIFKIWTEFEEIQTKVRFASLVQRLEVDQSKLQLKDCFPGKRCSGIISIHSSFVKPMRINSFHVSVPGLVVEYRTQNGLPEIVPNSITDVGRIHFDPKSVCFDKCYIPQEEEDDNLTIPPEDTNMYIDENELNRRKELYRKFKWSLQQITFTLNTSQVRLFEFNTTVDIIWPKLVKGVQTLPTIELGQTYNGLIYMRNPAAKPVKINLNLSDPKKAKEFNVKDLPSEILEECNSCYLTNEEVFSIEDKLEYMLQPNDVVGVKVRFFAQDAGTYSTLLYIQNNLTFFEAVWVTAKAVQPQFRFGNRKPGSQTPILFEINEKHLASCEEETDSKEIFVVSTKRTLTARNTGEVPIFVESFLIDDRNCEGYGFKIVDCSSFHLYTNSSKKIDLIFTPDFTMTRIARPLQLKTNLSYPVNYTLLATLPRHSIERCSKVSSRPDWEKAMKKCSVGMLSVAFIFVLVASFLDSNKVIKDHVVNLSKEKGPVQPPLDLRNIALKSSSTDETQITTNNGSISQEKSTLKNVAPSSVRKRNSKRNNFTSHILHNREKSWAEELTKKLVSQSSVNNMQTISTTENDTVTIPLRNEINSMTGTKLKEDKLSPPKIKDKEILDTIVSEKKEIKIEAKIETKIETIQQVEMKKPKITFKKTKLPPTPLNASQTEVISKITETVSSNTTASNSPERASDRNQKVQKIQKEKYEVSEKKIDEVERKTNNKTENVEKKITKIVERKSVPIQTEPPKSPPVDVATETTPPPQLDATPPAPIKQNIILKKYGKTPGRERKKEQQTISFKRTERKSLKYKGNAFQFSSPVQNNTPNTGSNVWDRNQASFSHVVSRKISDMSESFSSGIPSSILEQSDNGIIEHDWNEADMKNHETFGPDCDVKRNSLDLGPIGTKKSPSSTPVWEPLPPNVLHRPKPNMSQSDNSSFFSSNFPIASNLEYSSDNQYLGGASGLLDHLITESQKRRWQTNDTLFSLLQQRDRNGRRTDWEVDNRAWTPMGYQNNSTSVLPEMDVWNSDGIIRIPSVLATGTANGGPTSTAGKADSPNRLSQMPAPNLSLSPNISQEDPNIEPIQPFDPFSSLSSIWSETWTKKNNKN